MKLNLNLKEVQEESDGLVTIPAGLYPVKITSTEGKETSGQSGKGYQLVIMSTILNGEYSNYQLRDSLTLMNNSTNDKGIKMAENIGRGRLKRICRLAGIGDEIKDSNELHGKCFLVLVETETVTTKYGDKVFNRIRAWKDYDPKYECTVEKQEVKKESYEKSPQEQIMEQTFLSGQEAFGTTTEKPAETSPPAAEKAPWAQ